MDNIHMEVHPPSKIVIEIKQQWTPRLSSTGDVELMDISLQLNFSFQQLQ
jgi:hypothetical protein